MNWTWLHSKKKAATDAAIPFLVTFVVALTLIALIAVFGVWTSVGRIVAAAGRKPQTVKEPSDWPSSPEVEALKDALDVQSFRCLPEGFGGLILQQLDRGARTIRVTA